MALDQEIQALRDHYTWTVLYAQRLSKLAAMAGGTAANLTARVGQWMTPYGVAAGVVAADAAQAVGTTVTGLLDRAGGFLAQQWNDVGGIHGIHEGARARTVGVLEWQIEHLKSLVNWLTNKTSCEESRME
jgi:hypothetical protein